MLSGEKRRRRDRPQTGVLTPGTSALTKLSPERATEYITCLISNCLYLCRPFRTFHVVAQLPGVITPVCALSSLRDFRVSPHELLLSRKPNYRCISRGSLDFPRTAITSKASSSNIQTGRLPIRQLRAFTLRETGERPCSVSQLRLFRCLIVHVLAIACSCICNCKYMNNQTPLLGLSGL